MVLNCRQVPDDSDGTVAVAEVDIAVVEAAAFVAAARPVVARPDWQLAVGAC